MGSLPREIQSVIKIALKIVIVLIVIVTLVVNPLNSSLVMSITNQEFVLYHLKDLIENSSDKTIQADNNYFLATGTYEKNMTGGFSDTVCENLFGIAKNKNLILIQIESMQNMVINREYNGQEITPNLNALIKEKGSLYYDNYYQQIGSGNTSDAEFATNNSLLGTIESYTYQLFQDNYMYGLPWVLKENGYSTTVTHGYDKSFWNRENVYPTEGFDTFINSDILVSDNIKGIGGGNIVGISDHALYEQSMDYMKKLNETGEPFYNFIISLSSHNPFRLPDSLTDMELLDKDKDTLFGNYIASVHYADKALGELLSQLKESGIYDNSVIAMYGDHFGLTKSDDRIEKRVSEWLGFNYDYDMMLNIPLIIHIPNSELNETISISGGQLDFMPTIAYILGIEKLNTLYLGQNLLTAERGFVIEQTHLLKGSFIKDDIVFEISRDGVFEKSRAWNRKTREAVDITPYKEDVKKAKDLVELSKFYLYNDVLRSVYLEGKNIDDILNDTDTKLKKEKNISMVSVITSKNINKGILLEDFYEWMKEENKEDKVLLTMDNILEGLTNLESCSGKIGEIGEIKSIDFIANKEFNDIKSRIIPIINTMEDFTKIQYLGYENIVFMPNIDEYSKEQILDFILINKPYAIALPAENIMACGIDFCNNDVFIYAYDVETVTEKAFCNFIGVDGYIDNVINNFN
ncbi:LTA synthase family protein [Anaerovorax odorimutans]|uniref:LTA synthase family protein n=1 Tax=Anaerovorax odorimutans TaxID=109327 RepID=UPI0003F818F6|nr:LTA synthase family protein [Anaerovorax odorimutans]